MYNYVNFTKLLKISFVILIVYSIISTISLSNYYEEYNRVQEELIELSLENNNLKKDIEVKEQSLIEKDLKLLRIQSKSETSYVEYSVPHGHNTFRSWMPYNAISKESKQGQIISTSTSDKDGLMKINDCYCVALGTYYGELGDIFKVTTSTGNTFRVIKADVKSDKHTDKLHQYTTFSDCMMEFIVDRNKLNSSIKRLGSVNTDIISGSIVKIEKEVVK